MMKRTLCTMIVSLLIIGGVTPIWAENFSKASSSIEIKNQDLAFGKSLADQRGQIDLCESAKNPLLLSKEEKLRCEEAIKKFLLKNYEGYYSFDHFDFDYQGLFEEQGIIEVDILLRVDMTLIKDPNEYAHVQELRKQLSTQEGRGDMEENLERYVSYIRKECYKKPDATSFPFAIKLNQERKVQEMFYKDIQTDELLPLDVLKVQDSVKGTSAAEEALLMDSVPTRAGYDATMLQGIMLRLMPRMIRSFHPVEIMEHTVLILFQNALKQGRFDRPSGEMVPGKSLGKPAWREFLQNRLAQ